MNKPNYLFLNLLILLLASQWVYAASPSKVVLPASAKQALVSNHLELNEENLDNEEYPKVAISDFTGDKVDDVAVVISYPKTDEDGKEAIYEQLVLLQAVKPNQYALVAKSLAWAQVVRVDASVSVKRGSIYLNVASHDNGDYYVNEYQFKQAQGNFYLIGLTYEHGVIGEDKASDGKSVNLLSNKQIVWRMINDHRNEKKVSLTQHYEKIELSHFGLDSLDTAFYNVDFK